VSAIGQGRSSIRLQSVEQYRPGARLVDKRASSGQEYLLNVATDEWDAGIVAKLTRAIDLRDELRTEQERLRNVARPREYRSTSNERFCEDPKVWRKWWLEKAPPSLPLAFAALLGDVVQNLRAALEYSAWAAASPEARSSYPRAISFPIIDKPGEYEKWARRSSEWFNEATFKVLEWAQPFQADEDQLHPLRILRTLSNTDKHKLLNVVDHAHIELGVELDPAPPTYEWWAADGPVQEGELLAKLVFPRPASAMTVDVRPSFAWYESVAYEEEGKPVRWLRMDEMMNAVVSFSVDTVGYMASARTGLIAEGVQEDGVEPPTT
jgi:hypothetical protein